MKPYYQDPSVTLYHAATAASWRSRWDDNPWVWVVEFKRMVA